MTGRLSIGVVVALLLFVPVQAGATGASPPDARVESVQTPTSAASEPATDMPASPGPQDATQAAPSDAKPAETEAEAKPAPPPPPPITLKVDVDLGSQRVTVVAGGKTVGSWPISSGRSGYATPTGSFRPHWAAKMWYSRQYEMSPMPHSVFFNRGIAFHGTSYTGSLGRPASHGCVRLAPGNAATLYRLVHAHGYASTRIVVRGKPKYGGDAIARNESRRGRAYVSDYYGNYPGAPASSRNAWSPFARF